MTRYRKKPVVIDAVQWTGDNLAEIEAFAYVAHEADRFHDDPDMLGIYAVLEDTWVKCPVGHWVIRGVQGEFYPCDPDVFAATYDEVDDR